MSIGQSVITTALENLSGGKSVQVEKILKLNKTEVMDLILDEVIGTLEARRDAAQKAVDDLDKQYYADLLDYVELHTGLTVSKTTCWGSEPVETYTRGNKTQLMFYVDSFTSPTGVKINLRENSLEIPAPVWAAKTRKTQKKLAKTLSDARDKVASVKCNKSKFKSAVLKSLLSDHEEGQALLAKVKDVAKKLAQ